MRFLKARSSVREQDEQPDPSTSQEPRMSSDPRMSKGKEPVKVKHGPRRTTPGEGDRKSTKEDCTLVQVVQAGMKPQGIAFSEDLLKWARPVKEFTFANTPMTTGFAGRATFLVQDAGPMQSLEVRMEDPLPGAAGQQSADILGKFSKGEMLEDKEPK
jgi:hypothetical protein